MLDMGLWALRMLQTSQQANGAIVMLPTNGQIPSGRVVWV